MLSEQKFIRLKDGTEIHAKIKESNAPVWLITTHGIGEHLERHNYLLKLFGHHFNYFFYDLRGHGLSMGEKGQIDNFGIYLRDLGELLAFLKKQYKVQRYFLFGHSMGALITAAYLQSFSLEKFYPEKVFLSAPPVSFCGFQGIIHRKVSSRALNFLSGIPLSFKVKGMVDLSNLSHDPHVEAAVLNDPLVLPALHTKLLMQVAAWSRQVFSKPLNPKCSSFCAVGSADKIISVEAIKEYFSVIEKNVELKVFKDAYHEMHNEIEKYQAVYFAYLKEKLLEGVYQENL